MTILCIDDNSENHMSCKFSLQIGIKKVNEPVRYVWFKLN